MGQRVRFRPADVCTLEERVVMSRAGLAQAVTAPLTVVFNGNLSGSSQGTGLHGTAQRATVSAEASVGGADYDLEGKLGGLQTGDTFGPIRGKLEVDLVTHVYYHRPTGYYKLDTSRIVGVAILSVSGPGTDLTPSAPETILLSFRVIRATRLFSPFRGQSGRLELTVAPSKQFPQYQAYVTAVFSA